MAKTLHCYFILFMLSCLYQCYVHTTWWQHFRHWRHFALLFWQRTLPPGTPRLSSWRIFVFSIHNYYPCQISIITAYAVIKLFCINRDIAVFKQLYSLFVVCFIHAFSNALHPSCQRTQWLPVPHVYIAEIVPVQYTGYCSRTRITWTCV